jgi:hypothetical protein
MLAGECFVALFGGPTEGEEGERAIVAGALLFRGLEAMRNAPSRAGATVVTITYEGEEY